MSNFQKIMQHSIQAQIIESQIHSLSNARVFANAKDEEIESLIADKKAMLKFEIDAIQHLSSTL